MNIIAIDPTTKPIRADTPSILSIKIPITNRAHKPPVSNPNIILNQSNIDNTFHIAITTANKHPITPTTRLVIRAAFSLDLSSCLAKLSLDLISTIQDVEIEFIFDAIVLIEAAKIAAINRPAIPIGSLVII